MGDEPPKGQIVDPPLFMVEGALRRPHYKRGRWPMQISNVSGGAGKGQEDKISSNESDDRLCYGL